MSINNPKSDPKQDPPDAADAPDLDGAGSGRVKFDDRGNAIWEGNSKSSLESSSSRLRRLENPTLSLADDAPTPFDKVKPNPLGTKKGYDPYDSGKLGRTNAAAKKKDLTRLSAWLKQKKQQAQIKKDEE